MAKKSEPLTVTFHRYVETLMDEQGFGHQGVMLSAKGEHTLINMKWTEPPYEPHLFMMGAMAQHKPVEVVYGIDRTIKQSDMPVDLPDIVTVCWWRKGRGWKFGGISYRPEPDKLVLPYDWNNPVITTMLPTELDYTARNVQALLARMKARDAEA